MLKYSSKEQFTINKVNNNSYHFKTKNNSIKNSTLNKESI